MDVRRLDKSKKGKKKGKRKHKKKAEIAKAKTWVFPQSRYKKTSIDYTFHLLIDYIYQYYIP